MRNANAIAFMSPQFAVLSESQMEDLHLAALETLRRTGIRFFHPEAIEMLHKAGAFVSDGNLVKITAAMVEDAIATVPGRIIMCDREGAPTVYLEGAKVNFGTGSDCLNLLDPETGEMVYSNAGHEPALYPAKSFIWAFRLALSTDSIHSKNSSRHLQLLRQ